METGEAIFDPEGPMRDETASEIIEGFGEIEGLNDKEAAHVLAMAAHTVNTLNMTHGAEDMSLTLNRLSDKALKAFDELSETPWNGHLHVQSARLVIDIVNGLEPLHDRIHGGHWFTKMNRNDLVLCIEESNPEDLADILDLAILKGDKETCEFVRAKIDEMANDGKISTQLRDNIL